MTEWSVILLIIELVGFGVMVFAPLLKLNTNITTLNTTMKNLADRFQEQKTEFKEFQEHTRETHKEFYQHFERVDNQLENHELRIRRFEEK